MCGAGCPSLPLLLQTFSFVSPNHRRGCEPDHPGPDPWAHRDEHHVQWKHDCNSHDPEYHVPRVLCPQHVHMRGLCPWIVLRQRWVWVWTTRIISVLQAKRWITSYCHSGVTFNYLNHLAMLHARYVVQLISHLLQWFSTLVFKYSLGRYVVMQKPVNNHSFKSGVLEQGNI